MNLKPISIAFSVSLLCMSSAMAHTQADLNTHLGNIHAYYADEFNATSTTGNRVLEMNLATMQQVNALSLNGNAGHHADRATNSKLYQVPKGSGFINVVKMTKTGGTTSVTSTKKINLIHKPRSGDAINQNLGLMLMGSTNRPMGTLIDVLTDKIVTTVGAATDCTTTTGRTLRQIGFSVVNKRENATKYQCRHTDFGGNQISGHPYWLNNRDLAIVDRTNRKISAFRMQINANGHWVARKMSDLPTNSSLHQIVPRNRTGLPASEQNIYYGIEEGSPTQGIPPSVIEFKNTNGKLTLVRRMNLGRVGKDSASRAAGIKSVCRNALAQAPGAARNEYITKKLRGFGLSAYSSSQNKTNTLPLECNNPANMGGHNADFHPNNRHLYVGTADGSMFVVDVNNFQLFNHVDTGYTTQPNGAGTGHTTFASHTNVAIVTNHLVPYATAVNMITHKKIKNIPLNFAREGIFSAVQSHTGFAKGKYYYNFWTDGGVFYRIDTTTLRVDASTYTGGIPIQGSYFDISKFNTGTTSAAPVANPDTATATVSGGQITINPLANDTGSGLSLQAPNAWSENGGQVALNNNQLLYTPKSGFTGQDKIWYTIKDNQGQTSWSVITISVSGNGGGTTGAAPVANPDTATATVSGGQITITPLANDTGSGLVLQAPNAWSAKGGQVALSNNQLLYTPKANYTGEDKIWYTIADSQGRTSWSVIVITVNGSGGTTNAAPVANPDSLSVTSSAQVTINPLANDTGSGLVLQAPNAWSSKAGQVALANNQLLYTPKAGYVGEDKIWYTIADSQGRTSWSVITINVSNGGTTNAPFPVANPDNYTVQTGSTTTLSILSNDTPNGLVIDTLYAYSANGGTTTKTNNGTQVSYTPAPGFTGTDNFWYVLVDSQGRKNSAQVTITVTD